MRRWRLATCTLFVLIGSGCGGRTVSTTERVEDALRAEVDLEAKDSRVNVAACTNPKDADEYHCDVFRMLRSDIAAHGRYIVTVDEAGGWKARLMPQSHAAFEWAELNGVLAGAG